MSLEYEIFHRKELRYNVKLVNKCILIIKCSKSEKRQISHKRFVFRMMKSVIKRNLNNYIQLLSNTNMRELPNRDEIISECYIIFDHCLKNYKVKKGHNFYFYFNKSMSRSFFRDYRREQNYSSVELSDAICCVNPHLRQDSEIDTVSIMMDNFDFTDLEKKIALSKMNGQKACEFLEKNPDVNNSQYTKALKHIKECLIYHKQIGEI